MPLFVCLLTRFNHSRLNITNSADELEKIIEIITTDSSLITRWRVAAREAVNTAGLLEPALDQWLILSYRILMLRIFDWCSRREALVRAEQLASALPATPRTSVLASP